MSGTEHAATVPRHARGTHRHCHTAAPLVAIVGPTAAGKSDVAIAVAGAVGGEIVNADSMATYRGMDVGTAKPTRAEMSALPHHCYDIWDIREPAAVAAYQPIAATALADIRSRGRVPVIVGGSGLYVRALVDEIVFPGTDPAVRGRLDRELADVGPSALHDRLSELDPTAAAAILASNGRRIVRALEVIEHTGRPFSATLPAYDVRPGVLQIGLDRADLDDRIAVRVDAMWRRGLVDEVRRLERRGLRDGPTAPRALGYAQVLAMFDGACDNAGARAATVQATRRFARRQRSWFRRDPRVVWLEPRDGSADAAVAVVRRTLLR